MKKTILLVIMMLFALVGSAYSSLPEETAEFLEEHSDKIAEIKTLGGTGVIGEEDLTGAETTQTPQSRAEEEFYKFNEAIVGFTLPDSIQKLVKNENVKGILIKDGSESFVYYMKVEEGVVKSVDFEDLKTGRTSFNSSSGATLNETYATPLIVFAEEDVFLEIVDSESPIDKFFEKYDNGDVTIKSESAFKSLKYKVAVWVANLFR